VTTRTLVATGHQYIALRFAERKVAVRSTLGIPADPKVAILWNLRGERS